ncbi:MAG TPA: hypothetical protein DCM73_16525 [Clostridiales bacterium]|nr:hypothetical protein [Clostridiales bacterium]
MTDMTFGECLRSLLSILDISMNRLSKAINVDNSLVNRWIHGKRIPAYSTAYVENIAEYLSKSFHNSTQIKRLDDLFYDICENNTSAVLIKDKIKVILSECQGYSIERRKRERIKPNNQDSKYELPHNSSYCRNIISKKTLSLSADDKIFFGNSNVLSLCIDLMKSASNLRSLRDNTIYVTYNNYMEIGSSEVFQLMDEFRTQMLRVADKGINMCFLLKLDNNIDRILNFIKFIYPVLVTKRLMIYYYTKYGIIDSDREICIVPGVGALSCFPSGENPHEKCGFFLKNRHAVNIFNDYIKMLIKANSKALIKYYPQDKRIEYYSDLLKAQENIGNSFLYRTGQHPLMMPASLYKRILERKKFLPKDISLSMKTFETQLNAFKKSINRYEYYDICSAKAITDLINNRKFPIFINGTIETVSLNKDEVMEIMKNIIDTIKSFDNYKFSLIHDTGSCGYDSCYVFIKERWVLFYEMCMGSDTSSETKLSVNEPMVVSAAEKYFMEKHEQIAPINKDKHEIVKFMKRQMNLLNDGMFL